MEGDLVGWFMIWLYFLILFCFVFEDLVVLELWLEWINVMVNFVNFSGGIMLFIVDMIGSGEYYEGYSME